MIPTIGSLDIVQKRSGIPNLSRQDLINLKRSYVFVCQFEPDEETVKTRFYVKVIPEFNITKCESCHKACLRHLHRRIMLFTCAPLRCFIPTTTFSQCSKRANVQCAGTKGD